VYSFVVCKCKYLAILVVVFLFEVFELELIVLECSFSEIYLRSRSFVMWLQAFLLQILVVLFGVLIAGVIFPLLGCTTSENHFAFENLNQPLDDLLSLFSTWLF